MAQEVGCERLPPLANFTAVRGNGRAGVKSIRRNAWRLAADELLKPTQVNHFGQPTGEGQAAGVVGEVAVQ